MNGSTGQEVRLAVQEKVTPIELKRLNQKKVYNYIYRSKLSSKPAICKALELSLPTVTQHVSALMEQSLVEKRGEYQSTGGRKAQMIHCNATARIAVGIQILKERAQIVAVDLYGEILAESDLPLPFSNREPYYQQLGSWTNQFTHDLPYPRENILGVGIAFQGLVSPDGETIVFSEILHCTGTKRDVYQKYIDLPCYLIHDTEAAALAEIWANSGLHNAVYLSLNRNFGGAVIQNRQILHGSGPISSVIEHMCLSPDGPICYCGKQGCIETYCSVDSLEATAHMELDQFFQRVHSGDPRCLKIWRHYLHYLAIAVDNIRMIVDYDFILSGFLVQFIDQSDVEQLTRYVKERCSFNMPAFSISIGRCGHKAATLGAAILLIEQFLSEI